MFGQPYGHILFNYQFQVELREKHEQELEQLRVDLKEATKQQLAQQKESLSEEHQQEITELKEEHEGEIKVDTCMTL